MNKKEIIGVLAKVTCDLKADGYKVFVIVLHGSQNYNLDIYSPDYSSDIDCKAFVLPDFDDIYTNKMVSKVIKTDWGQVEIKDVRLLEELLAKANPSYLELLASNIFVTDYSDEWKQIRDFLPDIVSDRKALLIKCIYGMALEKQKALKHPYPATLEKIEKFGYDPKQLHHIARLSHMMDRLVMGISFTNSLWFSEGPARDSMLDIKVGKLTLDEAEEAAKYLIEKLKREKQEQEVLYPIEGTTLYKVNDLIKQIVKKSIEEEFTKE